MSVVYLLGAGFSAPLGIPVIKTFIEKSKDQMRAEPTRYQYFQRVFDLIQGLYKANHFFDSDVSNIEEVLSLLQADAMVSKTELTAEVIRYICDVVTYNTPLIPAPPKPPPSDWQGYPFGGGSSDWNGYGNFALALLNLRLERDSLDTTVLVDESSRTRYAVVSLNYDLVLENACGYMGKHYVTPKGAWGFRVLAGKRLDGVGRAVLAKLHGSIEDGMIVPPTWSKDTTPAFTDAWQEALKALSEAQEIRIIGYSLPVSDSHIRYLLKAAAIRNPDLRRVDVLCLDDPTEQVSKRYAEFVNLTDFKFKHGSVKDYLTILTARLSQGVQAPSDHLEATHAHFFDRT